MKHLALLLVLILSFSCSSSDDEEEQVAILPDSFEIKVELSGVNSVQNIHLAVNSVVVQDWDTQTLPFMNEYTYHTTGTELSSTSCECITFSSWAYVSSINEMETFKLYVNGDLKDSTTVTASVNSDGTLNPTKLEFIYYP